MTDTVEFIVTFPIYKPFRRLNGSLAKKLWKVMKSIHNGSKPKYNPIVSELNQFLFSSIITSSPNYLEITNRIEMEDKVDAIYSKFTKKILKDLKKLYTKDPELNSSIKAFEDVISGFKLNLSDELKKIKNMPSHVISEIEKIYKNGSLIIWNLPRNETDRIIAGYEKINREGDSSEEADINIVSDELALATFGKQHVPCLAQQVARINKPLISISNSLSSFKSSIKSIKNHNEKDYLIELTSVFLGKILGIRDPLNLAQKQLVRYQMLEDEIILESEDIGSKFLSTIYGKFIDKNELDQAISTITQISETISNYSEDIRLLLVQIENLSVDGSSSNNVENFTKFIMDIYFDLEEFRFITETFQDIASFTTMGGGIATEGISSVVAELPEDSMVYVKDVFKTFPLVNNTVYALRGIDLDIKIGEFVAIMGPSGSGKTTLLNIISGLDRPDRGIAFVNKLNLGIAREKDLIKFRRETGAFIYQSYNLLEVLNNRENVSLPADLGITKDIGNKKQRSKDLIKEVGLDFYTTGKPSLLSGGQQQRITIARALMNKPQILFADEPTGDLDSTTGAQIMDIIDGLHQQGVTIVVVTHDKAIANRAQRIIHMSDGKIVEKPIRN